MSSLLRKSLLLSGFISIIDSQLDRICEISIKQPWCVYVYIYVYVFEYYINCFV